MSAVEITPAIEKIAERLARAYCSLQMSHSPTSVRAWREHVRVYADALAILTTQVGDQRGEEEQQDDVIFALSDAWSAGTRKHEGLKKIVLEYLVEVHAEQEEI